MAAATVVPTLTLTLEEYLRTAYHPDVDFVDDHIEERNLGEWEHGLLQMELGYWFRLHRDEWGVIVVPELRTRVTAKRVRIPDICVVRKDEPRREKVSVTPAWIAIEILSPEDRMPRVLTRLDDFLTMGVEHIWLFDPEDRVAYTYSAQGLLLAKGTRLEVPGTPIYVELADIFSSLDQ